MNESKLLGKRPVALSMTHNFGGPRLRQARPGLTRDGNTIVITIEMIRKGPLPMTSSNDLDERAQAVIPNPCGDADPAEQMRDVLSGFCNYGQSN